MIILNQNQNVGDKMATTYDKKLDKEIFSEEIPLQFSTLIAKVMKYNKGEAKLQLCRIKPNAKGESMFAKLGRLTKTELELLEPVLEKAKKKMEVKDENKE